MEHRRGKSGYLSTAQCAAELGLTAATVRLLVRRGVFPASRSGTPFRIRRSDFEAFKKRLNWRTDRPVLLGPDLRAHPLGQPGGRGAARGTHETEGGTSLVSIDRRLGPEQRPFSVACDWCGTVLVSHVRREDAGRMVVVQGRHADKDGRPCVGVGRGIAKWPLRVELRMVDGGVGFELEVIDGPTFEFSNLAELRAKLIDIGASPDFATRRAHEVGPGSPIVFDVE
jgi:excisionase family DNA binding protein